MLLIVIVVWIIPLVCQVPFSILGMQNHIAKARGSSNMGGPRLRSILWPSTRTQRKPFFMIKE